MGRIILTGTFRFDLMCHQLAILEMAVHAYRSCIAKSIRQLAVPIVDHRKVFSVQLDDEFRLIPHSKDASGLYEASNSQFAILKLIRSIRYVRSIS